MSEVLTAYLVEGLVDGRGVVLTPVILWGDSVLLVGQVEAPHDSVRAKDPELDRWLRKAGVNQPTTQPGLTVRLGFRGEHGDEFTRLRQTLEVEELREIRRDVLRGDHARPVHRIPCGEGMRPIVHSQQVGGRTDRRGHEYAFDLHDVSIRYSRGLPDDGVPRPRHVTGVGNQVARPVFPPLTRSVRIGPMDEGGIVVARDRVLWQDETSGPRPESTAVGHVCVDDDSPREPANRSVPHRFLECCKRREVLSRVPGQKGASVIDQFHLHSTAKWRGCLLELSTGSRPYVPHQVYPATADTPTSRGPVVNSLAKRPKLSPQKRLHLSATE